MFCGVVQELCKCLVHVIEEADLFNMETEILEGARRSLVAPTSLKRALSPIPRVEEPTSAPVPSPPPASKLEGAASPEELALVPKRWLPPHRFVPLDEDEPEILPLEDVYGPVAMPMGTLLDLTALESLQVTISHILATGEVHYHLQAQSVTRMSLSGTSSQEQLKPSPKIKEL